MKHEEPGWAWPTCTQQLEELMEMPFPMHCAQVSWKGGRCFYHEKLARGLTCSHLGTVKKAKNTRQDLMALVMVAL